MVSFSPQGTTKCIKFYLVFSLGFYTSANLKMVVNFYEQIIDRISYNQLLLIASSNTSNFISIKFHYLKFKFFYTIFIITTSTKHLCEVIKRFFRWRAFYIKYKGITFLFRISILWIL